MVFGQSNHFPLCGDLNLCDTVSHLVTASRNGWRLEIQPMSARCALVRGILLSSLRDADDAVYGRNGYEYGNSKLRVEYPRVSGGKPGSMGGAGGGGQRGRFGPPTRRSEFRVTVTGLPASGSWQDLKDHMREAGDVCFADVQRDGDGVVEFLRREDMEYALRRLDRTEFRSHQGETSFIRVYEDRGSSSWAPARSRSRSRGRYSPPYFNRGSPPPLPRYHSPPRMLRHSPPPRRLPPQHHSPPPRHYR
uniref:Serine/arginine-rich splicing factor 9 n=1 Tax=Nothobranchius kuhntae TaxID=321403 RepID=A0A1A8KAP3_NOTKU